MNKKQMAIIFAILAAALYAINVPVSKVLLKNAAPTMMAAFLYLGAGIGLILYSCVSDLLGRKSIKEPLTKKEIPYTVAMVLLDIAAPILLMFGVSMTTSANVSLLNNFEIVATSLIALIFFKEFLSRRLWGAVVLVTIASILLGLEGASSFSFNKGSLCVLGACVCWGFENNCTKMLSSKSSIEIVMIKGCFSGLGSLAIALFTGEHIPALGSVLKVLVLGFVAYGLSINFYIMAQKDLGAAKTSAFYSIAPFLGVGFSMLFLRERPGVNFYIALVIMAVSTMLMVKDALILQHSHSHMHVHTHEHRHGDLVHTHEHTHEHTHYHEHIDNEEMHAHSHHNLKDHEHLHDNGMG